MQAAFAPLPSDEPCFINKPAPLGLGCWMSEGAKASCWRDGSAVEIDLDIADGGSHYVSLYMLDWDRSGRSQTVQISDFFTGEVQSTKQVNHFEGGRYLTWYMSGHVRIRITSDGLHNAVVSGLFFGNHQPAIEQEATVADQVLDTYTQGNWRGVYGIDQNGAVGGESIANDSSSSVPSYAQMIWERGGAYTWSENPTDPATLERASGLGRISSCWRDGQSTVLDLNLTDNQPHRVALYMLDYPEYHRSQHVSITDYFSGDELASADVASFEQGQWLSWTITGHVRITIDGDGTHNAVLSGIFFGGPDIGPETLHISGATAVDEASLYRLTLPQLPPHVPGWEIDWGDSTTDRVYGQESTTLTHTYDDGPATRKVCAYSLVHGGDIGNVRGQEIDSINVTVRNVSPTLTRTWPSVIELGRATTFSAAASDVSDTDLNAGLSYSWTIRSAGQVVQQGTGNQISFTPDAAGPYELNLEVWDKDGGAVADSLALYATSVDLDVDSDNNAPDGVPDRSKAEDDIEDDPTKPGKSVSANTADVDFDGKPGFADFRPSDIAAAASVTRFAPIILDLAQLPEPESARLKLIYTASDPREVVTPDNHSVYAPAAGDLRIWTKPASQARNPKPLSEGGDWVRPDSKFALSDLGDLAENGCLKLYVEGISRSQVLGDRRIVLEVFPDAAQAYSLSDAVRLTVDGIDLDVDSDNDDGFNVPARTPAEDQIEDRWGYGAKVLSLNGEDKDADGIPDFADGYNFDESEARTGPDDANPRERFVPLILELPRSAAPAHTLVSLRYNGSSPANVRYIDGNWTAAPGALRVWTKPGDGARTRQDYFAPGSERTAADLGVTEQDRTLTLWIEAISLPPDQVSDRAIYAAVSPDDGRDPSQWTSDVVLVDDGGLIGVDADRDGNILLGQPGPDRTAPDTPYRFWINNDREVKKVDEEWDEEPNGFDTDVTEDGITVMRDLEDFTRLRLRVPGNLLDSAGHLRDEAQVSLQFTDVSSGDPAIQLFQQVGDQWQYLTDAEKVVPRQQMDSANREEGCYVIKEQPAQLVVSGHPFANQAHEASFIFEGASVGAGALTVTYSLSGTVMARSSVYLDLADVRSMYEHYTVGDTNDMRAAEIPLTAQKTADSGTYDATSVESNDYILFVHGWRMTPWERRSFADTAFKRLWWQGYTGRFGLFSWPTEYTSTPWWNVQNFDRSAEKAWHSAAALRQLLQDLNAKYPGRVSMMAHSMGNIVASEALRLEAKRDDRPPQKLVKVYVASQAAVSADAYDANIQQRSTSWDTPNTLRDYDGPNQPYFASIGAAAGKLINYRNQEDFALDRWELNENTKPDHDWDYNPTEGYFTIGIDESGLLVHNPLSLPEDRYTIFSYINESHATALGATKGVEGPFAYDCDLNGKDRGYYLNFGNEDEGHSAQFAGTIMKRGDYWRMLLDDCGIGGRRL